MTTATYGVLLRFKTNDFFLEIESHAGVLELLNELEGPGRVVDGQRLRGHESLVRIVKFTDGVEHARKVLALRRHADRDVPSRAMTESLLDAGVDVTSDFMSNRKNPGAMQPARPSEMAETDKPQQRSAIDRAPVPKEDVEPGAWIVLRDAASLVPGGIWVFGPVALGAAAAVVLGLFLGSARLAVLGCTLSAAFVALFYAFAKGTAHVKVLTGPLKLIVWVVTGLFLLVLATLYACVFFGQPVDLRHWISDRVEPRH